MTPGFSLRAATALAVAASLALPVGAAAAESPARPAPRRAPVVVELCAKAGTMTLPGAGSLPVWGYVTGGCAGSPSLTKPGGPTLSFDEGDAVTIRLHNGLTVTTGLMFPTLPLQPDTAGTPAGGTKDYTFTATAGTHLYEAALLTGAQYQVPMGLYGAIDVLPAGGGAAYGDPQSATQDSSFDTSGTLVLSEIDPALNKSANPANFDLRTFVPRFGLINGATHPNTAPITAAAGDRVLVRYLNAGLKLHSMATLGVDQTIIANDAKQMRYPRTIVAETFGPGQTADVIVTVPAAATASSKYAIYDASLTFHNGGGGGTGGMLTFITLGGSGTPATTPTTTSVNATPNPSNGTAAVAVTATVSATSGSVDAAELYVDSTSGSPIAMAGSYGTGSVAVSATIPTSLLATLSAGTHVLYVRGHSTAGWGAVASTGLVLDTSGPAAGSLKLTPAVSRGAGTVQLTATGNDTTSGGSNVTGGSYTIDGGAPQAMSVAGPVSTVTALSASIPVGSLALSDGAHVVSVTATDALGNVGAAATVTLTIDNAGPVAVGAATATPSPNNGTIPVSSGVPAVRVRATFTDALSSVATAEGFIDTVGALGTGFVFSPTDGVWGGVSGATDAVFADVPLATVAALANGNHTILLRAKDAAGNWGPTVSAALVIDKQGPTVSGLSVTPPASNDTAVVVAATADDGATGGLNIGGGELFVDTAGANGTGIAMTAAAAASSTTISGTIPAATVAALSVGTHTIRVHGKDAVGNWGPLVNVTLLIDRSAPTFSSITVTPGSVLAGTASVALTVNGAADTGGSGVAGGEWWIGTTNITPGTGTAFSGTTATIPTAALAAGTYTVRVRIRDGAGNWSTAPNSGVRTATLVVYTDTIFANGFETGTGPWGWTSRSTNTTSRLNVTSTGPLVGTRSLTAQGNNTNYVQYDFGSVPSAATFDARFSFRPNGNASTGSDIFAAGNGSFGTTVFHVRYRVSAGQAQVQIQVGTTANASWVNTSNATHTIQVVWQAAGSGGPAAGTLALYVDGVSSQTLTHTSTSAISSVRLGSVTSGGSATSMSFDAFASKRSVTPLLP